MTETKRIYIGGLFFGVTKEDIEEKFTHFGKVSQVDIKQKKNTQGEAVKTFAYVNIDIAGDNLNKCLGTFNKSKWKGSQLKLQLAKESFIDRLQTEREHPEDIPVKPKKVKKSPYHNPLENLPDATDFHLKGATPGTLIEGEKNWVVGKYGRVLPIVYIRRQDKKKISIIKVDPSKFCHNIKHYKDDVTSDVKQDTKPLTWQMDDIKSDNYLRRQGVFPDWQPPKKVKKVQELTKNVEEVQHIPTTTVLHSESASGEDIFNIIGVKPGQPSVDDDTEMEVVSNERQNKKPVQFFLKTENDDSDGESISSTNTDDIIAAAKDSRVGVPRDWSSSDDGSDNDETEEVSVSVKQKSALSMNKIVNESSTKVKSKLKNVVLKEDANSISKKVKKQNSKLTTKIHSNITNEMQKYYDKSESKSKSEDDCAKSDVIAGKELSSVKSSAIKQKELLVPKPKVQSTDEILAELMAGNLSDSDSDDKASRKKKRKRKQWKPPEFKGTSFLVDVTDSSMCEASDLSNFHRLSINQGSTVNISNLNVITQNKHAKTKKCINERNVTVAHKVESDSPTDISSSGKTFSQPEELQIKSDAESDDSRNTDEIIAYSKSNTKNDSSHSSRFTAVKLKSDKNQSFTNERLILLNEFASGMNLPEESGIVVQDVSEEYDSEDYGKLLAKQSVAKVESKHKIKDVLKQSAIKKKEPPASEPKKKIISKVEPTMDIKAQIAVSCEETLSKTKKDDGKKVKEEISKGKDKKLLRKDGTPKPGNKKVSDNEKRLESLKQKVKENKNQREAIRKALSSVDKPSKFMNKKILFDSDEDQDEKDGPSDGVIGQSDGSESEESEEIENREDKKAELFNNLSESDDDSETDQDDFRLRPQFEGAKGNKLMALQSKYANDERFKLDEKFMESDSDEGNKDVPCLDQPDDEKSRSLKILEAVVGHRLRGMREKEKKQFKDVTGLHFDPTRDDHSRFEIKSDSKSSKRKKKSIRQREKSDDAIKQQESPSDSEDDMIDPTPIVSAERFYEVTSSIKDAFKSNDGFSLLAAFGDDENSKTGERQGIEHDEPIKQPFLFSSQQVFDSSDDDEEKTITESATGKNTETETGEAKTVIFPAKKSTFFFTEDDDRIKEGIQYFKRPVDMETVHEMWLSKRTDLVEAYRQKRKKMLRKQKDQQRQKSGQQRRPSQWKKK